ncbi:MAG: DUF1330 domain-containing protein [Janthinobacterium lividum]
MPKGYLIAHVSITDPAAYAVYEAAAVEAMKDFSPKVIAGSGQYENLEGESHDHHIVFEFASFAEAKRFYDSPEYQAARTLRAAAATGTLVLLEGTP